MGCRQPIVLFAYPFCQVNSCTQLAQCACAKDAVARSDGAHSLAFPTSPFLGNRKPSDTKSLWTLWVAWITYGLPVAHPHSWV